MADEIVKEFLQTTHLQLQGLFPQSTIISERFCGLVNSWNVHTGFAAVRVIRRD